VRSTVEGSLRLRWQAAFAVVLFFIRFSGPVRVPLMSAFLLPSLVRMLSMLSIRFEEKFQTQLPSLCQTSLVASSSNFASRRLASRQGIDELVLPAREAFQLQRYLFPMFALVD
jgi:hypothetical protein